MPAAEVPFPTEASAVLDFVLGLRGDDFDKGLQRYYAVHDLLITLLHRGEWPSRAASLKNLIAPLMCSTADQQTEFYDRFDEWVREQASQRASFWLPPDVPDNRRSNSTRRTQWSAVALAVIALFIAVPIIWKKTHPPPPAQGPKVTGILPPAATTTAPSNLPLPPGQLIPVHARFLAGGRPVSNAAILLNAREYFSQADGTALIDVPSGVPTRYLVTHSSDRPILADYPGSGPLEVQLLSAGSPPSPAAGPRWVQWLLQHKQPIRWTFAALPFAFTLGWWMWLLARRMALQKWNTMPTQNVLKLTGRSSMANLFPPRIIREIAQEMRRRTPRTSKALNGAATAKATAQSAGYFTPIYVESRVVQEYLVLIERTGSRDQFAQFTASLASVLQTNSVFLTPYYYTGDPRICARVSKEQSVTIEELAAVHPGHVLWILGDSSALADAIAQKPYKWVEKTSLWQQRFIFDCSGSEASREILRSAGFQAAPMDLHAIRAAVDVTLEDGSPKTAPLGWIAVPKILTEDLRLLFTRESPHTDEVSEILAAVRRYLGPEAYDCFCACAVYPQLSFSLTLALAQALVSEEQRSGAVERIVRLPWMRYGTMPDWLRKRLIRRLPGPKLLQARIALKTYLESAREAKESAGWLEFLRPRGRDKDAAGALSDFVFLGILWGLKPEELAAPSPGILSRLLYRHGHAMFGLRPLVHVAIASMFSVAFWFGAGAAERLIPQKQPSVPEDPLLRRVREVAESQVGSTQSIGLWRSPFVDWTFDQAAQLLGTATPLLAPSGSPNGAVYTSEPGLGIAIANKLASVSVIHFTDDPQGKSAFIVNAQGGTVQNYPLPANSKFQDLRLSSQPKRKIAVVSTSSKVSFAEVQRFVAAVQKLVSADLHNMWNVDATITAYPRIEDADPSAWRVTIQDTIDQPGAIGYHYDRDGVPFTLIDAALAASSGVSWTVSASHDVVEMLVNPFTGRYIRGPAFTDPTREVLLMAEVCNPVQPDQFAQSIDGVLLTDFVSPRWFYDRAALPGVRYDRNGRLNGPRQLGNGGYTNYLDLSTGHVWQRIVLSNQPQETDLGKQSTGYEASIKAEGPPPTNISVALPPKPPTTMPAPPGAPSVVVSSGSTVIPGTWAFDFDAGAITGTSAADVSWHQRLPLGLYPSNGARIVNLGTAANFNDLTLAQLRTLRYGTTSIDGSDTTNMLVPGDVFAVATNANYFAKVLVNSPFVAANNNGLSIRWVTLGPPGATIPAPTGECTGPESQIFDNWNAGAVDNGAKPPSVIIQNPVCLVRIATYHWNQGRGSPPGSISLAAFNVILGSWRASGSSGQGSAPNVNWVAEVPQNPPFVIKGNVTVNDSSPATWAQNAASKGLGFVRMWVRPFGPASSTSPAQGQAAQAQVNRQVNPKDGLTYVYIPPGKFMMGCSPGDNECQTNEKPAREVTITKGFWIGQTEVTQEAYERFTGQNPSFSKGAKLPVEDITWNDGRRYCEAVGMRLPTEAEWEYAARAGNQTSRYGDPAEIAWFNDDSGDHTHEVGQKAPNTWGLYDTLGNVFELTADGEDGSTLFKVIRGGSYGAKSNSLRVSYRMSVNIAQAYNSLGVRCAGDLPSPPQVGK
jgi:formylglycine-generating enzyme required for sulfatase activity